jgi:hypothetical protein
MCRHRAAAQLASSLRREGGNNAGARSRIVAASLYERCLCRRAERVLIVVGSVRWWGSELLSYGPIICLVFLTLPFLVLAVELRTAIGGYAPSRWGD